MKADDSCQSLLAVDGDGLERIRRALAACHDIDWRTFSFAERSLELRRVGPAEELQTVVLLLHAYKRVLLLLPRGEDARALTLLEDGFQSAIQIAGMPRAAFVARWGRLFPGEEALGEMVHGNAVARRSQVLLAYLKAVQEAEPHYRAARFD